MDLSWPLPPLVSVNSGTPRESFLGAYKKMYLPTAQDFCDLIRTAGKGCYLYSADVARAYRQLPLDPMDWPLVCFNVNGVYYTNISLPFGLRWAAAHCQDVTSLVTRELNHGGATVLSYINDFGGVPTDQTTAATHFINLRSLLAKVGLWEAEHKASPPAQAMVWLGLLFDTITMTVSLPLDKLAEIQRLVHHWVSKLKATLMELRTVLGKMLYMSQLCPPSRLFLNMMLDTLRQCPEQGYCTLSSEFHKDLAWFDHFLPTSCGTFLIHQDDRHPVHLYINACMSGCGAITASRACSRPSRDIC